MKKLICAGDVQKFAAEGGKICYIDSDTLVTAQAKDEAAALGIEFSTDAPSAAPAAAPAAQPAAPATTGGNENMDGIDKDLIYNVLKALADKGMLNDVLKDIAPDTDVPYVCETDPSGLKVVRGKTVRMDEFFEGNPRVTYQELIDKNSSNISSGLLIIDHDTYEWTQNYDENDYVIEGSMTVTINGRSYTANAGDCIFIPNGATVVMGSKDSYCKVFYNTYPSNWADLL